MGNVKWYDKYGECNAKYNMTKEETIKLWDETHTDIKSCLIDEVPHINLEYKEEN